MALLNNCSDIYYATLPACIEKFTVKMPFDLRYTTLHYFVTDKFGHVYHDTVDTNEDAVFEVSDDIFPDGFFNPWNGQLIMEIKSGMGYCEPLQLEARGVGYDRIVIDFKNGDFSTQIPCIC